MCSCRGKEFHLLLVARQPDIAQSDRCGSQEGVFSDCQCQQWSWRGREEYCFDSSTLVVVKPCILVCLGELDINIFFHFTNIIRYYVCIFFLSVSPDII